MTKQPRISVALATYNGERYLRQQLASLASQTLLPCELVVQDDQSRDDTVRILCDFASRAPFPVNIEVNQRRLGSTGNFDCAIGRCRGSHIALCDQDDVWLPTKVQRVSDRFAARANLNLVFSNALRVDENLRVMPRDLWQSLRLPRDLPKRVLSTNFAFDLLRRSMVTGATMAFSAHLRPLIQPIPQDFPDWIHDRWIATLAALCGPVEAISDPLVMYRQHGGQQIGANGIEPLTLHQRMASNTESIGSKRDLIECIRKRISGSSALTDEKVLQELTETELHLRARLSLPTTRLKRIPIIALEWWSGRYARFSSGAASAAKDLLV